MKISLHAEKSYKRTMAILFIVTVLFVVSSAFIGELLMPFAAAFFALMLTFEQGKPVMSIICAAVCVPLLFIQSLNVSVWGIISIIIGFSLYIMYRFNNSKSDTAILLTVITTVAIFSSFFIQAFEAIGEWNFMGALDFYKDLIDNLKNEFISGVMSITTSLPSDAEEILLNEEYVSAAFDAFVNTLISVVAVISFFLIGVTMKLFTAVARRLSNEDDAIHLWKFEMNNVYAYAYIAVYFISIFIEMDSVLGITFANVSGILSFMFCYVGLKFAHRFLIERGFKMLSVVIIAVIFVFLGTSAINLAAVLGAASTVYYNGRKFNNNNDNQDSNSKIG